MRLPEGNSMNLPAHTDNMRRKNGYKDSLPTQKNRHKIQCHSQGRFMLLLKQILIKYDLCILTQASEALRDEQSLSSEL